MRGALFAAALLLAAIVTVNPPSARAGDPALLLTVGEQDEMKTRNPLPAVAEDVWTRAVLDQVYDEPLKQLPEGDLLAYLAKGVDVDEDGLFESGEYDRWAERASAATPLEVTVYYDFNGVRWHDGMQVTLWDLLFSYHLAANHSRLNETIRVLFPAGSSSAYEDGGRQLTVLPTPKNWEGEGVMPGDPRLRAALRFRLGRPYDRFSEGTLTPSLFPMHVWSWTGGGRHADLGCALWIPPAEAASKNLPECGTADTAKWGRGIAGNEPVPGSKPFNYAAAFAWAPLDQDVIGSGPFRFVTWIPSVQAAVVRNEDYYTGLDTRGTVDTRDDILYDDRLSSVLRKPRIEGVRFVVYRTVQLGVFALQSGEIDFYHWNVGADFVPDLLKIPEIGIARNPSLGFYHLGYNLRKAPWGYENNDAARDVGLLLRRAIAHIVDKKSIVQNFLQNLAVVAHGFVSPSNAFWYTDLPVLDYNLSQARAILDSPEARAVGIGADPPGACSRDIPSGCRTLPGIGNAPFEVLTPLCDLCYRDPWSGIIDGMRLVGLNAMGRPTPSGVILQQLEGRDFDLHISGWQIDDPDPEYLFRFFHSANAAAGDNYAGFRDVEFDQVIEASLQQLDPQTRRPLVWQAQAVLAQHRPWEPLYFPMNIEAYRQDRFVNWTVVAGTIWNEWSLFRIRPPPSLTLFASITAPSAVRSNDTETVAVATFDSEGKLVAGAFVNLSADRGTLAFQGTEGPSVAGTTGASDRFVASFRAPTVASETTVTLTATASHWDYRGIPIRNATIRVFPPGVSFLSLRIDLPLSDLLRSGGALPIKIRVWDQDGIPVADADVRVETSDPGKLRAIPQMGMAEQLATVSLEADASIDQASSYNVTIRATKAGHAEAVHAFTVFILPVDILLRCPSGKPVGNLSECPTEPPALVSVGLLLATIVAAAAISGAVVVMWRYARRRSRRRGNTLYGRPDARDGGHHGDSEVARQVPGRNRRN